VCTGKYIVIVGNLFDGFSYYGTFEDFDEASEWGDANAMSSEWLAAYVNPPLPLNKTEPF
jgi:hypothetical protein